MTDSLQQIDRTSVSYRGRKLTYFSGCDYFRLASHPAVLRACQTGLKTFGLNVAASRLTTGNHPLYVQLERSLTEFFSVPSALLFSNGYAANLGVAQALAGEFTHVLLDERAHVSLVDAATLMNARVLRFRHRDPDALSRLVQRLGADAPVLLATDGVFAFNGAVAPLREYAERLPEESWIWVDDAHSAGVLGRKGRGTPEYAGVDRMRVVQTITLSKAFGVYGGAILAPSWVRKRAWERSQLFAGNTPMPLPLASGAITALELVRQGDVRRRLARNVQRLKSDLRAAGLVLPDTPVPMVTLTASSDAQRRRWKQGLLRAGIYPPLVHYPGFPPSGCFRFALSSEHTDEQLEGLLDWIRRQSAG